MNLYLTGIMGCGKTSAGKMAAAILKVPFFDLDAEVEKREQLPVSEIFSRHGEEYFRLAETEALRQVSKQAGAVVSTGGGIILKPQNAEIMKNTGKVVWIERPVDLILKCVDASVRPLIAEKPQILVDIYARREPLYRKYADAIVENTGFLEDAAKEIAGQYKLLAGI